MTARSRTAVWVVALAVALVASACSSSTPGDGPLLLRAEGRVLVAEGGDELVVADGDRRIGYGALVEVVNGAATVRYPDGAELELREGVGTAADTRLRTTEIPELVAGDLLVTGGGGRTVRGPFGTIQVAGVSKVTSGLALAVHVYEGVASVVSGGRSIEVAALRQAVIPAPRLVPGDASPLRYRPSDPWDRRFLGTAIDLGEQLAARARGFTAQLRPGEGRTPGFFRIILPGLDDESAFGPELLDDQRAPGETLVGAAIVLESAKGGDFVARWADAFAFRAAGAEWGLVALDHGASQVPLIDRIDVAIGRAPLLRPGEPAQVASPPTTSGRPAATTTTRPTSPTTSGTPTTNPTTSSPPPTTTTLLPPVPTTTTEPPGGLLDLLRGLGDGDGDGNGLGALRLDLGRLFSGF